jgi:hypothetical protein
VAADRAVLLRQSWPLSSRLLVFDEFQRMPDWKAWPEGVVDGRPEGQALLVTGDVRMDIFRRSGEPLAGCCLAWRLPPSSVREGSTQQQVAAAVALHHLMARPTALRPR